ncbi:hypothetical protein [Paenibacillus sp. CH40]|uniref:hypothetical protein n=1 Tax=Paenibacillus sp. CH40 TaxID=2962045 RepID=UPI0020B71132|nr:hypothetical protein [Paenibacillus sp. CH40]MCP3793993.1 hypothetical protein [Paenibacillus sp. CH40]
MTYEAYETIRQLELQWPAARQMLLSFGRTLNTMIAVFLEIDGVIRLLSAI